MNGKTIGSIVVLIIVVAGGWYLLKGTPAQAPAADVNSAAENAPAGAPSSETAAVPSGVTVTYTDQGFSPANITVPLGTTVTFVNQSSKKMWVASAMHPSHTVYSGTSMNQHCPDTANTAFDECRGDDVGASFSFTFNKEGAWKYHDHIDSTKFGSVTVTP